MRRKIEPIKRQIREWYEPIDDRPRRSGELTPSERVQAELGDNATTAIREAFGDKTQFDQLVDNIQNTTRPTTEIVRSISAYFDRMEYSEFPENRVMLFRLEAIARGEFTPEHVDINFMQHELLESTLVEKGIPDEYLSLPETVRVWRPAHDITSKALDVEGAKNLYHPDALRAAEVAGE